MEQVRTYWFNSEHINAPTSMTPQEVSQVWAIVHPAIYTAEIIENEDGSITFETYDKDIEKTIKETEQYLNNIKLKQLSAKVNEIQVTAKKVLNNKANDLSNLYIKYGKTKNLVYKDSCSNYPKYSLKKKIKKHKVKKTILVKFLVFFKCLIFHRSTIENLLTQAANRNGGILNIKQGSLATNKSPKKTEKYLDKMLFKGKIDIGNDRSGNLIYIWRSECLDEEIQ